jgi:putative transposase
VLGINVQSARPYTPTDKSQIERAFRTIRQSLLENLHGYKGPDVWSRGERVEDKALYFVEEVEAIFAGWVVSYYQKKPHEGLHMPGLPRQSVSPNEMYEFGLATAGFLCVPPSLDIYYQLLPIAWRMIGHDGVNIERLRYDGDPLNKYRNRKSSYGGVHQGRWPLRFDPRDYSRVFFQDPDDGGWHELAWVDAPPNARPFNDILLRHAKGLLLDSGRQASAHGSQELAAILEDIFDRVDQDRLADRKERKAMVRGTMQGMQADRDRGRSADRILPATETPEDGSPSESGMPQDNADPWNVDPSKIKAFPVWGDGESVDDLDEDEDYEEDEY